MRNTVHNSFATLDDLVIDSGEHPERAKPIWSALRAGCGILLLKENTLAFDSPVGGHGAIVIVEDNAQEGSIGPEGFDADSLDRLAPRVDTLTILAHGPCARSYRAAAKEAMRGGWALVIETKPKHEHAWRLHVVPAASEIRLQPDPQNHLWRINR